jgi:hypothetical protein
MQVRTFLLFLTPLRTMTMSSSSLPHKRDQVQAFDESIQQQFITLKQSLFSDQVRLYTNSNDVSKE